MILWFIYIQKYHRRYSLTEPQPSKQVMQDILSYSYTKWNIRYIFVKVKNKQTNKQKKQKEKSKADTWYNKWIFSLWAFPEIVSPPSTRVDLFILFIYSFNNI